MTGLTRRGTLLGASAVAAAGSRARAASPVRLGILADMSGPCSEDARTGSVVAADLAVEDFARDHPELKVELLAADAGTKTDTCADAGNTIKQAAEFGLTSHGTTVAATLLHIPQVHAVGLRSAQGLVLTDSYYWDLNGQSRAFAGHFAPRVKGFMPASTRAGVYSAVTHHLKTAPDIGADAAKADGRATVVRMKRIPTDDPIFGKRRIRWDSRKIHDMYLFEVKDPSSSKYPWDYYRPLAATPAEKAFRPKSGGGCAMVK